MPSEQELKQQLMRATAYFLKSNWPEAETLYKEVLDAKPTNPAMEAVARTYRSLALASMGYQRADRTLLDEALTEARRAVRVFQRANEPPESLALAHRAIGMSISFMISQEIIRSDEWPTLYPEGIGALKKAIQLDPGDQEARKHLGLLNSAEPIAKLRGAKTGGCFIATAASGDAEAFEVIVLSAFRDDFLTRSRLGRLFVRLYYSLSPTIATVIASSASLRRATMALIVRPAVKLVQTVVGDNGLLERDVDLSSKT